MSERSGRWSLRRIFMIFLIMFLLGVAAGVAGWIWISGGSGEASVSVEDALATRDARDADLVDAVGTVVYEAVGQVVTQVAGLGATMEAVTSEPVAFSIVSAESRATFTLEEDLRGVRTTVVGVTDQVAGKIMVDFYDPSASSIGTIVINARTLETDNSFRNRALRSAILRSAQDEYEFIVFEPSALSGFSADTIAVGDAISFEVTGDLTVVDVTRTVTFQVEATLDSETQISGVARVNVLHADFGLTIPEVPSVANVREDVDLALAFVARAGG